MNDNFYKQVTTQLQIRIKKSEENTELIITNKELAFQAFKTFNFLYRI